MTTLRFGLLGTGHWASTVHGAALAAHPDAELVGVWGRDPAKAAALAATLGAKAYADVDVLLADVDAVSIATPPDVQAELAVRAAAAGRHLLLDKPLALDVAAADRIVAEVDRRGLSSVVFFTNLFQGNVQRFLAETAATGPWHAGRVVFLASIFRPDSPYADSVWRKEHGGLWDLGPHALSLLLPVLGPVARVDAVAGPQRTSHVTLRHAGGAVSTLMLSAHVPPAAARTEYTFLGDPGTVTVPRGDDVPVVAFASAIDRLLADARAGVVGGPLGVHHAREIVRILAEAEAAMR